MVARNKLKDKKPALEKRDAQALLDSINIISKEDAQAMMNRLTEVKDWHNSEAEWHRSHSRTTHDLTDKHGHDSHAKSHEEQMTRLSFVIEKLRPLCPTSARTDHHARE